MAARALDERAQPGARREHVVVEQRDEVRRGSARARVAGRVRTGGRILDDCAYLKASNHVVRGVA